jgi:hypothetical protein
MEIIFVTAKTPLIFLLAIATVIVSALGSWCWCSDKDVCHEGQSRAINQKRFSNPIKLESSTSTGFVSRDNCCSNCFATPVDASLSNQDSLTGRAILVVVASVLVSNTGAKTKNVAVNRQHFVASRFACTGAGWDICLNKRSFLI